MSRNLAKAISKLAADTKSRYPEVVNFFNAGESDNGLLRVRRPHWPEGKFQEIPCFGVDGGAVGARVSVRFHRASKQLPWGGKPRAGSDRGKAAGSTPVFHYFGLWSTPEGSPLVSYAASQAQPPISWGGSEIFSETLERFQSGGGAFDYENQKGLTDPTGLVRYSIGDTQYLAVAWPRYNVSYERRGHMGIRVRNLSTGAWLAAPLYLGRQVSRLLGPFLGFAPGRREGQLFHCPHPTNAGKQFLFVVFPGSATKIIDDPNLTGNAFAVLPHDDLASGHIYEFSPDSILDRPDPGPDPTTNKVYAPVERSGSVSVANMSLLEGYWAGWMADSEEEPDLESSDRSVIRLYKIDPETFDATNYTKSLRVILSGAFGNLSEILACGILSPYDLYADDSVLASGYAMQLGSSRWPYNPIRNSFQMQVGVKLDQFGIHTPRAISVELKLDNGEIGLMGAPRQPEATIEEPYSGFLSEQSGLLASLIPEYIPGSYGYTYLVGLTSQVVRFMFEGSEACALYDGPDTYWPYTYGVANTSRQFWGGVNSAAVESEEALPVRGEIVQFPLPVSINNSDNPYYLSNDLPIVDHSGLNYGQVPSGVVTAAGVYITCEARPQRVVTSLEPFSDDDNYLGSRPDGTEGRDSWPTYDDYDPDHVITDWFRFAACWEAIPETVTLFHRTIAIEGKYDTIETYYRSFLVMTSGETVVSHDISCRFKLTDTVPRFDNYSAAFNVFKWGVSGGVLWILRLWPSDWVDENSSYSTIEDVREKLEPFIEIRRLSSPGTVLGRVRLRPSADTGDLWAPEMNYPPSFVCNVSPSGVAWVHVLTQWQGSGDSHLRHAYRTVTWSEVDGIDGGEEDVLGPSETPTNRPSLVDLAVCVVTDSQITWIDDCKKVRTFSIL